jgi:hypothetical protein
MSEQTFYNNVSSLFIELPGRTPKGTLGLSLPQAWWTHHLLVYTGPKILVPRREVAILLHYGRGVQAVPGGTILLFWQLYLDNRWVYLKRLIVGFLLEDLEEAPIMFAHPSDPVDLAHIARECHVPETWLDEVCPIYHFIVINGFSKVVDVGQLYHPELPRVFPRDLCLYAAMRCMSIGYY